MCSEIHLLIIEAEKNLNYGCNFYLDYHDMCAVNCCDDSHDTVVCLAIIASVYQLLKPMRSAGGVNVFMHHVSSYQ